MPEDQQSKEQFHLEQGFYFLRKKFDRVLCMYHFGQVVRYNPKNRTGWRWYLASMFLPKFLL